MTRACCIDRKTNEHILTEINNAVTNEEYMKKEYMTSVNAQQRFLTVLKAIFREIKPKTSFSVVQ